MKNIEKHKVAGCPNAMIGSWGDNSKEYEYIPVCAYRELLVFG